MSQAMSQAANEAGRRSSDASGDEHPILGTRGLPRRGVLGVLGLGLGLISRPARGQTTATRRPPRLVILMQANGTHQPAFWPDGPTLTSPILEPLTAVAGLEKKLTLVKGVSLAASGPGNGHDLGYISWWTGRTTIGQPTDVWASGPSLDQQLKRLLPADVPIPTLNCGVQAAVTQAKNGHRSSFSYIGPRQQVPTEKDPYRLYDKLFGGLDGSIAGDGDPARARQRLARRKSVLDFAAWDLRRLAARAGASDRVRLEAHATALRELEGRLGAALPSTCVAPGRPKTGLDAETEENVPALADLQLGIVAAALACRQTRIVTFPFGWCGNQWRYKWLGMDVDTHEEVAHRDTGDPVAATRQTAISRWHAERVARFVKALDAVPDGDGTVLDDSLVIWANENADGTHGLAQIPVVLVGRAGGALRAPGRLVELPGPAANQIHHRFVTTVMRLMGVQAAGFGDRPTCGAIDDLLA